jgi:iron complex outermembrane receptor protein
MTRRTPTKAAHLLLLIPAFACGQVYAQEVLEEVIVTAQKRDQNILDVGIAMTALTGDQIKELNLQKNIDIAGQTPGLLFSEGTEQLITISSIRGVSQNDVSFHIEPPNAIYVDHAYVSILSASNFQMYDLEHVEVLKGPQGTLFGRNATGGLMHFLSNSPGQQYEGYADLQFGENAQLRFEGAIGGALSDTVSARLSLLTDSYDGYAFNTTLDEEFRGRDENGVRAQLQFDPNEDLSIRLIGSYGDQDSEVGFKHAAAGVDEDGLLFTLPSDVNFWGTCQGCDPSGHRDFSDDPYTSNFETQGFFNSETWYVTGIIDWAIGDIDLTSVTNFLDYEAAHREDGEMAPRPGINLTSGQDSDQFSQEFRLSGSSQRTHWITGVYFIERDANSSQIVDANLQYLDDVLSTYGLIPPGFLAAFGTTDNLLSDWRFETSSQAVFGQVEFDFTPQWTLVTGLRYTKDKLDYRFDSKEFIDGFPLGPGGILGETSAVRSRKESDWSGKLGLEWRPNEDWLYYLSFSRGTKSGGYNAPFLGGEVTEFDGEVLESVEIGFKSTLMNGRATLDASAFMYDYSDYQGYTFVDFAPRVSNLDAEIAGLEAQFYMEPGAGWKVGLGLSLLDTKIKDVVLPSQRITDRSMPLAPDVSVNALVRKSWPAFGGEFAVMLDYTWMDDYYSETLNNPSGMIESYGMANARLSFLTGSERWEFALNVRNLTDYEVLTYRIPISDFGFNQDQYGKPRWMTVQATYRW